MKRSRPPQATVIDFAEARRRRDERKLEASREEHALLPFFFEPGSVSWTGEEVVAVLDEDEGIALSMSPESALKLAKALRAVALYGKKRLAEK